ncbi:MAG: glycosyltransferase [Planctomycetaceae bacterium]
MAAGCACEKPGACPVAGIRTTDRTLHACRSMRGYYEAMVLTGIQGIKRSSVEPAERRIATTPCEHRGPHLGDFRCDSCGTATRPVYQCELNKRCADSLASTGVVACATCADYLPGPRETSGEPITAFARVYAINLDHRPDRWRRLVANLGELPEWPLPQVRRLNALHGDHAPDRPAWWQAGGGAWGCRTSHVRILEECVRDGVESVLIFEDDALLPADFVDQLRAFLAAIPEEWEQLYLGGQHQHEHRRPPQPVAPGVLRPCNVNRTHAWAFRGDGIRKCLAFFQDLEDWSRYPTDHIDHRVGRMHESGGIRVYCPEQWIVGQAANKSDIDGRQHGDRHWYRAHPFRPEWVVEPREGAIRLGVYYPRIDCGGAERWLANLIASFRADEVLPAGIAVDDWTDDTRSMPWPCTTSLRTVAHNADVMIVWGVKSMRELRQHFAGPVVTVSHGGCGWSREMLHKLAPFASHWAAVSRHAADAYEPTFARAAKIIPPAVTLKALPDRQQARRELGIRDRIAIGYVGRASDEKDPFAVARAVAVMPEAVAVYCGPDTSESQWYQAAIRQAVGDPDRLIWLGRRDDVETVYAALDCLLLTSPSEGFGIAAAEAMLAGVPVVASQTGFVAENPDLVTVVPSGAGGSLLADAVSQAIADADRTARAAAYVADHCSFTATGEAWQAWLSRIVARERSRAA